jgi:hypothetical protein
MKAKHALNPVDTAAFVDHYPCTTLYSAELVFMVSDVSYFLCVYVCVCIVCDE